MNPIDAARKMEHIQFQNKPADAVLHGTPVVITPLDGRKFRVEIAVNRKSAKKAVNCLNAVAADKIPWPLKGRCSTVVDWRPMVYDLLWHGGMSLA